MTFSWSSADGQQHTWAQALQLQDDKIIDIQDHASPTTALALMRVRTAFG